MNFIRYFLEDLADLFFPPRCPFCDKIIEPEVELCEDCEKSVFDKTLTGEVRCMFRNNRRNIGNIDLLLSQYTYSGCVANGIILLKSDERFCSAGYFADKLALLIADFGIQRIADVVTFVPPHRSKRERSLSERLARLVARKTGIPCQPILKKIRATESQHMLSWHERQKNLNGAFQLAKGADVAGKIVLLVDDVVTSGSTLNECAGVLKKNGHASAVFAATIAAAPVKKYHKKSTATKKRTAVNKPFALL